MNIVDHAQFQAKTAASACVAGCSQNVSGRGVINDQGVTCSRTRVINKGARGYSGSFTHLRYP